MTLGPGSPPDPNIYYRTFLFQIFCVAAVDEAEQDHLPQEGDRPADWVGNIQALGRMELLQPEEGHDPTNADAADTEHRDQHGRQGHTHAPQAAR